MIRNIIVAMPLKTGNSKLYEEELREREDRERDRRRQEDSRREPLLPKRRKSCLHKLKQVSQ